MSTDRLVKLSEALGEAAIARDMAEASVWNRAWESYERELLERLLKCGPEDDVPRYRLQIAIEVSRHVKRVIEHQGRTVSSLQKEMDILEGRKLAPIA